MSGTRTAPASCPARLVRTGRGAIMARPAKPAATAILLLLAMLFAGAPQARARAAHSSSDAERAYQSGNSAYQVGRFAEAVRWYEQGRATGWSAPQLEYNEANALLKSGRLGRAIAGYERALRMGLDDPDVTASLRYARGLTRDPRPAESNSRLVAVAAGAVRAVAPGMLFVAGWACLLLAVVFWTLRRGMRRPAFATGAGIALSVGLVLQAGAVARQLVLDHDHRGVILGTEVPVRSGPGLDFPAPFTLHEGATVHVGRSAGPWREIELSSDVVGWVPEGSIEPI